MKIEKPSLRKIDVLSFWIIDLMNSGQIGILKTLRKVKAIIGEYATLVDPFLVNFLIFYPPENIRNPLLFS